MINLMPTRSGSLLSVVLILLWPALALSQLPRSDQLPLGELIEIVVQEEEFLAIDARGGGTSVARRQLDEDVIWVGSRGLIGVVVTDRRVLAVATGSAQWQEAPYERGERPPADAALGDRVALITLRQRVLGFLGTTSRFAEVRLGPNEDLAAVRVGANVAAVVTDRQAYGLSPEAGGFFSVRMQLREKLDSVSARSNLVTVQTDQRVLVFRGPTGTWAERRN
jgi:hypothetical protein